MVAEIAVALVLLVGAGLLMRSFARLQRVDPGFEPENALAVDLSLPKRKYPGDPQRALFVEQASRALAALPGVQAVGATQVAPMSGDEYLFDFSIKGRTRPSEAEVQTSQHYAISPDYFRAMGIRLLKGRVFDPSDTASTTPVAIVNETMVRQHFPGEDPLGQYLHVSNGPARWRRIVGVVRDVRQLSLDTAPRVQSYEPLAQHTSYLLTFVVRTASPLAGLPAAIRGAIHSVDREQPVARITPLTAWVAGSIGRQRFAMVLFGAFAAVALLLAAIGIYGVMAYSVRQRTGEIGLRMALGADSGQVVRLVLAQGGRLVALGLGIGVLGALILTRFLSSMLFGVSAHDPVTFAVIAALLAFTAALACLLPARRASAVDPMTALRAE